MNTTLKNKLINGKLSLGSWITLGNSGIAEIMSNAGFDWLVVDLEHSTISIEQAGELIRTIELAGVAPLIRLTSNNPDQIKRVMDAGAHGIVVPMVNRVQDARDAVSATRYSPEGTRGVGLARAQGYGFNFENYRDGKAKKITLIVQIEHINAINELEDIINIDGVDGTFIGPYDLSGSLGKPGKWDDDDVKQALLKYEKIAQKHEKLRGFHVVPPDYKLVNEKINKGYNFIAFSFDAMFLGTIIRKEIKNIKK